MQLKKIIPLLLILFLALFLRVYKINTAPNGLLTDEASFGYNAYSILKTGRDEFGTKYPLSIKSFGDYKYPAYVYASVLPIKIFELNNFSVRFVSLVSGIILIVVIFSLLTELGFNSVASVFGALITAVSPWTVLMSRFAFESNFGMLLFTIGLLFFVAGVNRKNSYFYTISGFFFGLSWYSYLPFRPISVLFMVSFSGFLLFKQKQPFKNIALLFFIFIITISPLLPIIISKEGTNRIKQNSMVTNPQIKTAIDESRTFCMVNNPKILCALNSNKPLEYLRIMTTRYFDMFSIHYLFLIGETQRYLSVENFGLFPFFLIPFYLLGLMGIIRRRNGTVKDYFNYFLISGLLLSGLPSAVLPTQPIRTQLAAQYPFMLLLIVYGFSIVDFKLQNKFHRPLIFAVLILFGFVYLFNYVNIHVRKHEDNWEYIEKLMVFMGKQDTNTTIYLKPFLGEPLIFYAFYTKMSPDEYQKTVTLGPVTSEGFQHVVGVKNVHIYEKSYVEATCESNISKNKILYVTNENLDTMVGHSVKPLYIGKSTSKVANLAYVYNANDVLTDNTSCK